MKRSIISVVTASVALALAGCGSGQYSQTAAMPPSAPGASAEFTTADGYNSVSVRNATLAYPGVEGYQAGSEAQLDISLFNDTSSEQRVVIKSQGQSSEVFTIAPAAMLKPDVKVKLAQDLNNAGAAKVEVEFVGLTTFQLNVPVAPPMAPAPQETVELEESAGGEGH